MRVGSRPVPAARLLEVDAVVGRETAPARVPRVEAASTQHLVVGGRAAVHRPNFWPKGLCGAPRRSRGAPFAVDRLRGLPRGRDGAGAAGGGVRAPCDTAPKMSALRCYPLFTFFTLQLGKVYLQTPAAILPRRGPGEAGQHSSALDSCPRRRMVHVVGPLGI